ncbi:MAG: hypothetical protein IKL10_06705 [Clostridia bacterium]|nr:hypothetical protein [Clostridia bacterium]
MTDKELKKLSRLELLEILLEETKENEKLRSELETANNIIKNATIFSDLIGKMNNTLNDAQSFTTELRQITDDMSRCNSRKEISNGNQCPSRQNDIPTLLNENKSPNSANNTNIISDKKLYISILKYFLANESALNSLPFDIQSDVRTRLRGILDAKKNHTSN